MIVVKFRGGLGNQIFQYALYLGFKAKNIEVFADISNFSNKSLHNGFELDKVFNLSLRYADSKVLNDLIGSYYIRRFFQKYLKKHYKADRYYIEQEDYVFDPLVYDFTKKKYLMGFWQNRGYVNLVADRLRSNLVFKKPFDNKTISCIDIINNSTSISIHIRRGDYLNIPRLNQIANQKYYKKSISYMENKFSECKFIFFSDDINWVRNEYGESDNNIFVDWNSGENSYVDMYLMSLCKHNIIAASTFSWWGAWLNDNPNKIVIAPEGIPLDMKNALIYDDWKIL